MLGTPPAFILSQDQTLEIFLYTSLFRLTYLLFRARSALSYCSEFLLLESRVLALPVSISLYLVPLYFSRSHTSLYVCCSIFNDPIPLVPSRRQLCYYTTPPLACQPLLKSFFQVFFNPISTSHLDLTRFSLPSATALLYYHFYFKLSSRFLKKVEKSTKKSYIAE